MKNSKSNYLIIIHIIIFLFFKNNILLPQKSLILGADLSFVNQIEDCGGRYTLNGIKTDPFALFQKYGASMVRVRLWHTPSWTNYSNYPDAEKTIRRAKEAGMKVLLDLHYSDSWADPQKQIIPATWADIANLSVLCDSIYTYTYNSIRKLDSQGLLPEIIQLGNEINIEILNNEPYKQGDTINWKRNIALLNKAIQAVHDASKESSFTPETMIHIAQPENALVWFKQATNNQIADYDLIGISYYSKWSGYNLSELCHAIEQLRINFDKEVMVVETAYPWTLKNYDEADNILGEDALEDNYPANPKGQLDYMIDLTKAVLKGGGSGVIYWEPAWITSPCSTEWGKGSHWENACFFDAEKNNEPLPVFQFFSYDYGNN